MKASLSACLLAVLLMACEGDGPAQANFLAEPNGLNAGWHNAPQVKTPAGALLGTEDEYDTWAWRGVPYAEPPVGQLRWKAPRELAPWKGLLDAREYGNKCAQWSMMPVVGGAKGYEDCLNLSIWRPRSTATQLPVYVWVHGGANVAGSADQYPGARVSASVDAVYVSLQYRLGPLGWASHRALRQRDSTADNSGNYGTLDLISALGWVKRNVAAFGGNPDNITLGGTSAGAINIMSLALSPVARALIDRAILISPIVQLHSTRDGELAVEKLLLRLLVADGSAQDRVQAGRQLDSMSDKKIRDYLYSRSSEELSQASFTDSIDDIWPTVYTDGHVIVDAGTSAFVNGTYPNPFPTIVGSSKEEGKFFMLMDKNMDSDDPEYQLLGNYSGLTWKASVDSLADAIASHPGAPPIYVYRFDWGAPRAEGSEVLSEGWTRRLGAAHSIAPQFFLGLARNSAGMFGRFIYDEDNEPGREHLISQLFEYTSAYIRSGDPNGDSNSAPHWFPWSAESRPTLLLNADKHAAMLQTQKLEIHPDSWLQKELEGHEPETRQRVETLAPKYRFADPLQLNRDR